MKTRVAIAMASVLLCAAVAVGQDQSRSARQPAALNSPVTKAANKQSNKAFDSYREQMYERYGAFRNKLIDDYDKFLSESWERFEQSKAIDRYEAPKPQQAPKAPAQSEPSEPTKPVEPSQSTETSQSPETPQSSQSPEPPQSSQSPETSQSFETFSFFGIELNVTDIEVDVQPRLLNPADFASQWRALARSGLAAHIVPELQRLAKEMQLNDYLTYALAGAWVDAVASRVQASSRASLLHYLMVNMGYDVRVALSDSGQPLLLINLAQMCYARPYLDIDGVRYFVFTLDGIDPRRLTTGIHTCRLPSDASSLQPISLLLTELNIPNDPRPFEIGNDHLKISGTVNQNLAAMLYRYPQMPMADYARSVLCSTVRGQIVDQLRSQLANLPIAQAVDELLHFVQDSFDYATDEENHGFEKPYFFEEMLLYPRCDCEDRAIFYTYLLWHVLGVNNQLINYPGHESAAVALHGFNGSNYIDGDRTYYISDPTYIGSSTGMCIPRYQTTAPTIDFTY